MERTLNCCGFSHVDVNGTCPAVSKTFHVPRFSSEQQLDQDGFVLLCPSELLQQPFILRELLQHPPELLRSGAAGCGRHWALLQLHRGQRSSLRDADVGVGLLHPEEADSCLLISDPWSVAHPQVQEPQRSSSECRSLPLTFQREAATSDGTSFHS